MRRPGASAAAWLTVAVGVAGVSSAAPIAAGTLAPALAIAFWRNAIGAAATAPVVALRHRGSLRALPAPVWRASALSGLLLAVHFGTWLTALRLTSVTAATALVCTTPVRTVAFDLLRRVPVPRRTVAGVAVSVAGVIAITGVDAAASGEALLGDALALAGAVAMAGYVAVGERVRRRAATAEYTLIAYAVCALAVLPVALLAGQPLAGWGTRTWLELLVLTACAQLLGHTLLNAALPRVGATPLALATLLEVPGAALLARAWLGQVPPPAVLPGAALMLAGLVVVVRDRAPGVVEVT